ncbi:MAG: hypothetical protein CL610_28790 [Anaerolineaceae bacterium]|nr:hypothetical protein [Anaerolineaceae bacterium]
MAERQKWEYMTVFVKAESALVMDFLQEGWDWKEGVPRNTPESMIPRLDAFGDQGWELVHMQPVMVGNHADVLVTDSGRGMAGWTSTYFCVFKRPA